MTLALVDPVGSADYTVGGRCKSVPRVVDQYAGWYSHAPRLDVWQGNGLVPGTLPDITGQIAAATPTGNRTQNRPPHLSRGIFSNLESRGVSAPAAADDPVIRVCHPSGQDQVPTTNHIAIIPPARGGALHA